MRVYECARAREKSRRLVGTQVERSYTHQYARVYTAAAVGCTHAVYHRIPGVATPAEATALGVTFSPQRVRRRSMFPPCVVQPRITLCFAVACARALRAKRTCTLYTSSPLAPLYRRAPPVRPPTGTFTDRLDATSPSSAAVASHSLSDTWRA